MKAVLKKCLPRPLFALLGKIKHTVLDDYSIRSYSQEGEDLILARLFEEKETGFYVDVGAHHPKRFSNTYYFYRKGWRGINIEPNPDALALFHRYRKRDINLGFGIADREGELVYYMFNEPALNSFDRALSEQRQDARYRIVDTKTVEVKRLAAVLERNMPKDTLVDFMSIDVEGYDLKVLESNDWSRFRPTCVLVEAISVDLGNIVVEPVNRFLMQKNYRLFAKTFYTLFYLDGTVNNPAMQKARTDERR
jgi:FkbM family methyltransferase